MLWGMERPPGRQRSNRLSQEKDHLKVQALGEQPRVVVDFDLLRRLGGRNFRDLGGHPTIDGRLVRTGKIYRSAHLANVPDVHPLRDLTLRTLITLQSRLEVRHLGPPIPEFLESGVRWEHIPIGDPWFREDGFHKIDTQPGNEHLVILTEFLADWLVEDADKALVILDKWEPTAVKTKAMVQPAWLFFRFICMASCGV